ncbi:glycosyltransferase family 4 protein [bacterium]|nr:glycosyltransferase family 4 protein [bacterium]
MKADTMRLWLASPHFYPTYGGAQNRYRGYIPGFQERGLDVRVLAGTPDLHERTETDVNADWYDEQPGRWLPSSELDCAGLERIRLPDGDNLARTEFFYKALLEVSERPAQGPVVLQVLTNLRPEALPWLRQLRKQGVIIVYSMSQFPRWPKKRFKRILRRFGFRRVFNEFDAIVTNSEAIESLLQGIGVKTRIEYIPNGVNLQRFRPLESEQDMQVAAALRQRLGIPMHHKVIATVGAVMPRKGQDKLVKAWRLLLSDHPDTHLLIVGPRSDIHNHKFSQFGQELAQLISSSQRPEQVHFTGAVNDVENWLLASDLFALPSDREGTPNSVLEAMASGLPCVVTPFAGISAGIGVAGRHYQLAERRPQAIAAALSQLLESDKLCREMIENGRRFVEENADQGISLDSYARMYTELCNGNQDRISEGSYALS